MCLGPWAVQALGADRLRAGFADPPVAARPTVWWHRMNGNVTPEGIRKDLERMKRVGVGGVNVIEPRYVRKLNLAIGSTMF